MRIHFCMALVMAATVCGLAHGQPPAPPVAHSKPRHAVKAASPKQSPNVIFRASVTPAFVTVPVLINHFYYVAYFPFIDYPASTQHKVFFQTTTTLINPQWTMILLQDYPSGVQWVECNIDSTNRNLFVRAGAKW